MREIPENKTHSAQHTVPKFYLKGFSDDEGHITAWIRKNGTLRRKALKYTSTTPGYYTVLDKNRNESDMVEELYSSIEGNAKPIFERMTCVFPLIPAYNSEERMMVSIYLATQFARTKQNRRKSQLLHDYFCKLHKIMSLSNQKTPLTQQQKDFLYNPHIIGELKQPQDIYIIRELRVSNEILPFFYRRRWTVVQFNNPCLITSDTPIVLVPGKAQIPVGLATAPEYWFPIDDKHLLILSEPSHTYDFTPGKFVNYSDIMCHYSNLASLYDMANSLQLQNCCQEAYGEKGILRKYEGYSLSIKIPFSTSPNLELDSYYVSNDLNWEPVPGHNITTIDF